MFLVVIHYFEGEPLGIQFDTHNEAERGAQNMWKLRADFPYVSHVDLHGPDGSHWQSWMITNIGQEIQHATNARVGSTVGGDER